MEGEAERIEHDDKTERTQFFVRAYVKSGQDEARGQFISYDGLSESYVVTSGPEGSVAKSAPGKDNRVRVVIQPKDKGEGAVPRPRRKLHRRTRAKPRPRPTAPSPGRKSMK